MCVCCVLRGGASRGGPHALPNQIGNLPSRLNEGGHALVAIFPHLKGEANSRSNARAKKTARERPDGPTETSQNSPTDGSNASAGNGIGDHIPGGTSNKVGRKRSRVPCLSGVCLEIVPGLLAVGVCIKGLCNKANAPLNPFGPNV